MLTINDLQSPSPNRSGRVASSGLLLATSTPPPLNISKKLNNSTMGLANSNNNSNNNSSNNSARVSPLVERLNAVKNTAQSFNGGLMEDLNSRKEVEQTKVYELRDTVSRLEKDLTMEMRKRADGDKVLQTMCDNKINTIQDLIEKKMSEKFSQMQQTVDTLTKRVLSLEKCLAEEKDYSSKFSTSMKSGVLGQLEELRNLVEDERLNRLDRESQMMRKFNDEYYKLSQKLDTEKKSREIFMNSTREEIERIEQAKAKIDQDFRAQLFEEIDSIRDEIKVEKEQREIVDEQIVSSLDTIIKEVHDSLRLVTK